MVNFLRFSASLIAVALHLLATTAAPIDGETYRELTDGAGNMGACRGSGGGSDRVDSRYAVLATQQACETECDDDAGCLAYAHNVANDGCVLYGPGQDGTCSLSSSSDDAGIYHNFQSCGDCFVEGGRKPKLLVENLCGSCSKEIPAALSNSQSICSTVEGVWTAGTWTAGVWMAPGGGWEGNSFAHDTLYGSSNVHTISVAASFHCYDKIHSDGQATCGGTFGRSLSCQTAFEDLRTEADCAEGCTFYPRDGSHAPYCDGIASDGDVNCIQSFEATALFNTTGCAAVDSSCVFQAAPEWTEPPLAMHAPPVDLGPGWMPDVLKASEGSGNCKGVNIAQCEGKDHVAGFGYGVCRTENNLPNGGHLNQKWCSTCKNTDGDLSNLNERTCAQTCLDDPSGTCVAFSQADNANCIIYGVDVDQYLYNPGDTQNQWGGWTHKHKPCIKAKFPIGCEPITTIKPNQKFICRHLAQDNTRWLAWGDASGSEQVTVELIVSSVHSESVRAQDFSADMKTLLQEKMAEVAFVDAAKDVTVDVESNSDGTAKVVFAITSSTAAHVPMTGMLDTVLVSKTRDGSFYFYDKVTGGNSNKNTGLMVPKSAKISGIVVKGMQHNLVDKSKEPYVRGWSDVADRCLEAPSPTDTATIRVDFTFDNYPTDTSWILTNTCNGGDAVVAVSDNYAGKGSFSKTYTVPDGTFNFEVIDSYEDGICCANGDGDYSVYRNGAEMIAMDPGSNYGKGEVKPFGSPSDCPGIGTIRIDFTLDFFPDDISWKLFNTCNGGKVEVAQKDKGYYGMGTTSETFYVQDGIFELEVTDDYGDGMETGSYSAYRNGVEMVSMEAGFNFGKYAVEVFGSDDFCA